MTRLWLAVAVTGLAATASAQSFFKNQPPRLTLDVKVEGSVASPARPAHVTLVATPVSGVHVYAPGNPDYIPVSVAVTPIEGLTVGEPALPAGEHYFFKPLKQAVKVYSKPFVVRFPVKATSGFLKKHRAASVTLKGAVSYQACDDKVCFPPQTLSFEADVPLKAAAAK